MNHPPHGSGSTLPAGVRTKAARKTYPRTAGTSGSNPAPLSKRPHVAKSAAAFEGYQGPSVSPVRRVSESSETMVSYDMASPTPIPSTGPLDMSRTRDPAGAGISTERVRTVPSALPESIWPSEYPVGQSLSLPNPVTKDFCTPDWNPTRKWFNVFP